MQRALHAVIALLCLTAGTPARAVERLDFCAPVAIRPDQRWWSTSPCEPWWKPDTLAARADFVFDGFPVPATLALPADRVSCFGDQIHANSKAFHDDLRARAAALGRTLEIVHYARFDLVTRQYAALAGFDADFLVSSEQSLDETAGFFTRDLSAPCVCGCTFSEDPGPGGAPPGTRLSDYVDASGGPGTYEGKVQYTIRPGASGAVDGSPRRFFASAAIADLRDPVYRAWRVADARAVLSAGGFDYVELNHKFPMYAPTNPPYWWGGPRATDVAAYLVTDDTLWSGKPLGYGYSEYVQGWWAMAEDLRAGEVPFTVTLAATYWRAGANDDPSTPLLDESERIRAGARLADVVFVDRIGSSQADVDAALADLAARSLARVVVLDSGCGLGPVDQPTNPLPALVGQLVVSPDAGAVAQYAANAITVRPFGTAAGPWSAELFCHCPSGSCGTPDASAAGLTGSSWSVPASTCDARWNGAAAGWRPRVRITRAGSTAESLDTVTVCTPACRNGRDDDGDGTTDFPEDVACASPDQAFESSACDNGKDDDGDGLSDVADPGCYGSRYPNDEDPPPIPTCGLLGVEAVAVLVALAPRRRSPHRGSSR